MTELDLILSSAGTGDPNFTLHDDLHSFRVASWGADLLGSQVKEVSAFDLGFTLAAAYAHDVGMTPALGRIQAHYDALLAVGMEALPATDALHFQRWLDDERDGLVPPLAEGRPSINQLREARLAVAHYSRSRHNDWSEEWVRDWAARNNASASLYPGWIDHLVRICRSHHEGYERLSSPDFDPQLVGSPAEVLHLRHCAVLLRVADILDMDPGRTPDVIFRHRSVDRTSEIFWRRDHAITVVLEDYGFVVVARPGDAPTHKAVLDVVAAIDSELRLCRRLADEKRLSVAPNLRRELPNHWPFESHVRATIDSLDDSYEYIDGTFRPDVGRVLRLLGGTELYGNEWAALREMLQNAFDAVNESMARERLGWPDAHDPDGVTHLRRRHLVRVELSVDDDGGATLTCSDTGVGMTKERILQRFLVSGSGKRHDDRDLERRCEAAGFSLERTARFGIGVLSYFMLGDSLSVESRRASHAEDHDGITWRFTTGGPDTFGELRRGTDHRHGTVVAVPLGAHLHGSLDELAAELRAYVERTVLRVPCTFECSFPDGTSEALRWDPGWAPPPADAGDSTAFGADWLSGNLPVSPDVSRRDQIARERAREEYWRRLRWLVEDGELPDRLGYYRVLVPWYETPHGPSLMNLVDVDGDGAAKAVVPPSKTWFSWFGMQVDAIDDDADDDAPQLLDLMPGDLQTGGLLSLDLTSDEVASPTVSRESIAFTERSEAVFEFVRQRLESLREAFAVEHAAAEIAQLNFALAELDPGDHTPPWWWFVHADEGEGQRWSPVTFPATTFPAEPSDLFGGRGDGLTLSSRAVTALAPLSVTAHRRASISNSEFGLAFPPDAVFAVVDEDKVIGALPVWVREPLPGAEPYRDWFYPEWREVAAIRFAETTYLNTTHPTIRLLNRSDHDELHAAVNPVVLLEQPEAVTRSAAHVVAAWIFMRDDADEIWTAFGEAYPELTEEAHRLLVDAGIEAGTVSILSSFVTGDDGRTSSLTTFRPGGCTTEPADVLPVPAGEVVELTRNGAHPAARGDRPT
ncbi:ATP-binding protein [Conexibacter stalactiti]|uniref:ATP-binding protein n=1 Tax=Conexibacter stalactiti TaxID=1940611 RepID=A0ABU4HNT1_9ACTN|nr:ATP-binding protein [Conexibacter stalactiti]MDW5593704.1 ATP-binding protein [Conexibacter stalactiti]MEC5034345.1 ATP-binding protein [Conexibacter stalactiti]